MKSELQKILEQIDIVHLLNHNGNQVTETRQGWRGFCPACEEKEKLLSVAPELKTFQCLNCSFKGHIPDYVKKIHNTKNGKVITYLKEYHQKFYGAQSKYKVITFKAHEIVLEIDDRTYQITGFDLKRLNYFRMTLRIEDYKGDDCIATVNLTNIKSRHDFVQEVVSSLYISEEILKSDLQLIMKGMRKFQQENIKKKEKEQAGPERIHTATKSETNKALDLLNSRDILTECLLPDTEKIGFVGDLLVKGVLFLGLQSRMTVCPAPVLSVTSYAGGKSFGQDMTALFFPQDSVYSYTRLTPQAFSHFEKYELVRKGLVVDEFKSINPDTLSQLRALISKGKTETGYSSVDKVTGNIKTLYKEVLGPMSILSSTTHADLIDEETASRFLLLSMDETIRHNKKVIDVMIHQDTPDGILNKRESVYTCRIYQAIQKCLKPYTIVLPDELEAKIVFPHRYNIYKRQYLIYRSYMHSLAILRQYQRQPIQITDRHGIPFQALEITMDDIKTAAMLMEPFVSPLIGKMNPDTEKCLNMIIAYCKHDTQEKQMEYPEVQFSRRDIREFAKLNHTSVARSMYTLLEMEYIVRVFGKERSRHTYKLNLTEEDMKGGKFKLWRD